MKNTACTIFSSSHFLGDAADDEKKTQNDPINQTLCSAFQCVRYALLFNYYSQIISEECQIMTSFKAVAVIVKWFIFIWIFRNGADLRQFHRPNKANNRILLFDPKIETTKFRDEHSMRKKKKFSCRFVFISANECRKLVKKSRRINNLLFRFSFFASSYNRQSHHVSNCFFHFLLFFGKQR